MGRCIGIDLGTTYCAVAIPGERQGKGFVTPSECPGYTVIADSLGRRTTPSVVAEDAQGRILVGHRAKNLAGSDPEPIMFAKRYMGESMTFRLGARRDVSPREVSAHILRYLAEMASEQLGEPVTDAVITVPAYFSNTAKRMTEKAGHEAGLNVLTVAQEPVAAALVYCLNDPRESLTLMTYDLGGGTFDVALLEKRAGTITTNSLLAFDGDRFLGGYDFDQLLVTWLVEQLAEQGFDLHYDFATPEGRVVFAKLLVLAERAKIQLSKEPEVLLSESGAGGWVDRRGETVAFELWLARETFEDLIRSKVDDTIELCRNALTVKAQPPLDPSQLDEIVMVGGSSRIPLIAQRLEEEFGQRPRLLEPDLCVALGAAILAGALSAGTTAGRLRLDPLPQQTELTSLVVSGRVEAESGTEDFNGCTVRLTSADGGYESAQELTADASFAFANVALFPDELNEFELVVTTPRGEELARHAFGVQQSAESGDDVVVAAVTNVLSKPIGLRLREGLLPVAAERTPLPHEETIPLETGDTSGQIRLPILEGATVLGELVMTDVPTTLPVGSLIRVTLRFQENYQITAEAYVESLAEKTSVVLELEPAPQRTLGELRAAFEELRDRADDAMAGADAAVLFAEARGPRLKRRLAAGEELLRANPPEGPKIEDCLEQLEALIAEISAGWQPQPPRPVFEARVEEAKDQLAKLISLRPDAQNDGHDDQLAALENQAMHAYREQDTTGWKDSWNDLQRFCDSLDRLVARAAQRAAGGGGGGGAGPDPTQLQLDLAKDLERLQQAAVERGRYAALKDEFDHAETALKAIDPTAPDAMTRLRDWYFTTYAALRNKVIGDQDAAAAEGLLSGGDLLRRSGRTRGQT